MNHTFQRHRFTALAALLALSLPVLLASGSLATELLIFAMAAMACNLLLGFTGLMSFGQGVFYGVGSYATGLLLLRLNVSLPVALLGSLITGALAAALIGWFAIRQRGVYFVMLTLAFAQMFYFLAYSMVDITGGDNGLLGIERPNLQLFGWELFNTRSPWSYYTLVAVVFLVVFIAMQRITASKFGRTLMAIRDNEARAAAVGYNVRAFKLLAFVISGAVTGLAGGLHAMLSGIAPLSSIEYHVSETILLITVIGGPGNLLASVIGAAFYVVAADWLASIWPRWMMLLGFLLIGVTLYMQKGIWGVLEAIHRRFQRAPANDSDPLSPHNGEQA